MAAHNLEALFVDDEQAEPRTALERYLEAKEIADQANLILKRAKENLLQSAEPLLRGKNSGTVKISEELKVRVTENRKWDQKRLQQVKDRVAPEFWPFRTKEDEDRRQSRDVEAQFPDLWALLSSALTVGEPYYSIEVKR